MARLRLSEKVRDTGREPIRTLPLTGRHVAGRDPRDSNSDTDSDSELTTRNSPTAGDIERDPAELVGEGGGRGPWLLEPGPQSPPAVSPAPTS